MISSEVQRTLVKSPPELWAEISDPESLARHLGEFGEIRITRVQPEQKVEWEADDASGTVVIKPSGWGTKVKLTVTRAIAPAEPAVETAVAADDQLDDEQPSAQAPELAAGEPAQDVELEPDAADITPPAHEPVEVADLDAKLESGADIAPIAGTAPELESASGHSAHDEPQTEAEAEPQAGAEPRVQDETTSEELPQPEAEPRRGFFARLFGRRRPRPEEPGSVELAEPAPLPIANEPIDDEPHSAVLDVPDRHFEPADEPASEHAAAASTVADDEPIEIAEQTIDTPEQSADRSEQQVATDDAASDVKLAEELAAEEVTAVLTGVLDRLGAAHHRPFSRA
ncbi:MAG TPA: hypothetical protein VN817_07100 [Solirubrobacteraceae bacterium]|nr:hypothetical protein [Solirubrobacteraceae bacterium]